MTPQFLENIGSIASRFTEAHGWWLYGTVRTLQPSLVVETGTCNGYITAFLAAAVKANGVGKVISIDYYGEAAPHAMPGSMAAVAENLARVGVADAVELVQGEALATLTAMALNGSLREAGLIVLDDNHDYEHVLAEMRACWLVLPPLGIIAGHDVYVDGLEGVNRAFLEISEQPNAHLVLSPHSQGYGLLQKRNAKDSCPWK